MTDAEMRDVVGYRGQYLVTPDGRIFSNKSHRFLKPQRRGYFYKQGKGYLSVRLHSGDGSYEQKYVHEIVLEAFVSRRPEKQVSRHIDGNSDNNHMDNLCWGTSQQNSHDRVAHGTSNRGERNPRRKLTEHQVHEIRESEATKKTLAERFGIHISTVSSIRRRKSWAHLAVRAVKS